MDKSAVKSKKEAKEEKQKDQKIEEQVLKMLDEEATGATPEERFALLLRKYVEEERGARRVRQEQKAQEKQLETVLREKENLQREYNKSVLMRDKLQEVCREQQKLIKSVKNESIQKIREEEERRKESQLKFQTSLNEITQSLAKNSEENSKLRDHNIDMTKKLKLLADQYHLREQQLEKLNEQVQLEAQLQQAKLNKAQVEAAMEKEVLLKEKQIALEKFVQSQKMLKELSEREMVLKEQLNLYTAKYEDFQSSLQKSNDIFATYKAELDKMSKNTRKLEKECLEWKMKWEKSNAILIELATEKKDRDEHAVRCSKQVEQLQKLLRALQNERTHLYKVMRDNNVACPPLPALPPEPEIIQTPSPDNRDKMEMMTRNCAELKQTLADLQNQMKHLNVATGLNCDTSSKTQAVQGKQQVQEDINKKRQRKNKKSKSNKTVKESLLITKETSEDCNNIAIDKPNGAAEITQNSLHDHTTDILDGAVETNKEIPRVENTADNTVISVLKSLGEIKDPTSDSLEVVNGSKSGPQEQNLGSEIYTEAPVKISSISTEKHSTVTESKDKEPLLDTFLTETSTLPVRDQSPNSTESGKKIQASQSSMSIVSDH